ncbi:MAG: thioesterase family protein [Actinomycetota bacterium]
MGDLAADTDIERLDAGRFRAAPSRDWEIWGPMGGYIASFALRAVGATVPAGFVPASMSAHYLGVARFEPIDIRVVERRAGRSAGSHRVEIGQDGTPIVDAMVWSAPPGDGLEHDEAVAPVLPGPDELPTIRELLGADEPSPYAFWENLDAKPTAFEQPWPPDGPRPARWQEWLRFRPTPTFDDPWVDAIRSLILVDLPGWPSASRPHAWSQPKFIGPTLDVNVVFHRSTADEPWLLADGAAPVSTGGLFGWNARVWSPSGQLHASGGGQCIYRRTK